MRIPAALGIVLLASCTAGYRAGTQSLGIEPAELACAQRIHIGEEPHSGMPHVPREEHDVALVEKALRREMPGLILVGTPDQSDFVISVLLTSKASCTHCPVGPNVEWVALVERGGPVHRNEYNVAPMLELHGSVSEGASAPRGSRASSLD